MAKKEEHTGRRLAIGTLVAGVAGYVTGILTAPKSGKETREDIGDNVVAVKDGAADDLQILEVELKDLLSNTKKKTVALSAKAREEFDEAVMAAKDAQNKSTYVLKAIKSGEADNPEVSKAIKQARLAKKNLGKYFKS